mgnify:CR=1 FL=1
MEGVLSISPESARFINIIGSLAEDPGPWEHPLGRVPASNLPFLGVFPPALAQ